MGSLPKQLAGFGWQSQRLQFTWLAALDRANKKTKQRPPQQNTLTILY